MRSKFFLEEGLFCSLSDLSLGTSLLAQMVKHLPTMWETQVQSLGWEDLLEKEMATHSSIFAWKIPRTEEEPVGYSPRGHKELDMTERLHFKCLKDITH